MEKRNGIEETSRASRDDLPDVWCAIIGGNDDRYFWDIARLVVGFWIIYIHLLPGIITAASHQPREDPKVCFPPRGRSYGDQTRDHSD